MVAKRRGIGCCICAICCSLLLCLSACGVGTEGTDESRDSGSPSHSSTEQLYQSTGGKLASSISDFASKVIREDSPSDFQRNLLEKVVREGSMSAGDYENAWGLFKRCFTEKGHGNIAFTRTSTGIYNQTYESPPDEKSNSDKIQRDFQTCADEYESYVALVYEMQVGNPNLYSNPREAALDCLHKSSAVPKNYSLKQLNKDMEKGPEASINIFSTPVQDCLVPNGIYLYDVRKQ